MREDSVFRPEGGVVGREMVLESQVERRLRIQKE